MIDRADIGDRPPIPVAATTPDDIAAALRDLRTWAGAPSYAAITKLVVQRRTDRGLPAAEATIGRVTVYDCFRTGRSRLDLDLVTDIVTALGLADQELIAWRQVLRRVATPGRRLSVAEVRSGLPDPAPLFGRSGLLLTLTRHTRSVLLHGMPGVGKTALAHHVARVHLREGHVREVLRVNLRGVAVDAEPVDPDAVVDAMLRVLGRTPDRADPLRQLHDHLDRRPLLLLLDNAADEDQVLPLLPGPGSPSVAVITSRRALRFPGVSAHLLEELDVDAAREVLAHTSARRVAPGDLPALDALGRVSGRLPLALDLIGRQVARTPTWSWADHAQALRRQVERLELADEVEGAVALSYAGLSPLDQRVFRRLCYHPGPDIGLSATRVLVVGADEDCAAKDIASRTAQILERLVTASLLRSPAPDRWAVHDLVPAFGRRRAEVEEPPSVLTGGIVALLTHYVDTAALAVHALAPLAHRDWPWWQGVDGDLPTEPEASAWLSQERVNLLASARWAASHGHQQQTVRLAAVLAHWLWRHGDLDLTLSVHRAARSAAVDIDDDHGLALAERNIGNTLLRLTRYDDARPHLERAVRLNHQIEDHRARMASLNSLAMIASATGDQEGAHAALAQIVRESEGGEPDEWVAMIRANLALALHRSGRVAEAVLAFEAVATECAQYGWRERERYALVNMMDGLVVLGRLDDALAAGRRALALAREDGDRLARGYAQSNLIAVLTEMTRFEEAHVSADEADAIAREVDALDLLSSVSNRRGDLLAAQGRDEDAVAVYREALDQALAAREPTEIAHARRGLAHLEGRAS